MIEQLYQPVYPAFIQTIAWIWLILALYQSIKVASNHNLNIREPFFSTWLNFSAGIDM